MKKKIPSRQELLRPVTLYLDDLEQIVEILQSLPDDEISFETKDYKIDSLDELANFSQKTIYDLEISRGKYISSLRISLKPNKVELYMYEDKIELRGAFEEIKDLLKGKERYYTRLLSFYCLYILVAISIILIPMIFWNVFIFQYLPPYLGFSVSVITLVYLLLTHREKLDRYSTIYLIKREKQTSFFNNNKEKIYLIIITAIVTALVSAIISNIFGENPK